MYIVVLLTILWLLWAIVFEYQRLLQTKPYIYYIGDFRYILNTHLYAYAVCIADLFVLNARTHATHTPLLFV